MKTKTRVGVLNDWQGVAKSSADWSRLSERAASSAPASAVTRLASIAWTG